MDAGYVQENPYIYLSVDGEDMIFQITAVFVTDTEFDYIRPEFETDEERTEFHETVARKSLFAIDGAAIEDGDKLLTLSTCCTLYDKDGTRRSAPRGRSEAPPRRGERSPLRRPECRIPGDAGR